MRKFILMTSAVVLFPLSSIAQTTCTASPSCTSLGYTESSCPDGNGVKCPWGNKWFCIPEYSEPCYIGSIFYSDKTCSMGLIDGKSPIAVVVYIDDTGGGQALALNSIGSYVWSTDYVDIPGLPNLSYDEEKKDYASCENSKIIMAQGNKNKYPAVWAANEYSTEGTNAGDWCLPAAGIFASYANNREATRKGLSLANGTPDVLDTWLSSEKGSKFAASAGDSHSSGAILTRYKDTLLEVRPVIEF